MGWRLFRMRDNTLANETRNRQAWMHLYLGENEEEKRREEKYRNRRQRMRFISDTKAKRKTEG
jgi:hypothetical protein